MPDRFQVVGGYRLIRSLRNGGIGIEVFAHDPKTGDGVIPYPLCPACWMSSSSSDIRGWLWAGKLRKRGAQIIGISTGGEPETPFENMRDAVRRRAVAQAGQVAFAGVGAGRGLHEWMVRKAELCGDMAAVKAANPLSTITVETLTWNYALVTDLGSGAG